MIQVDFLLTAVKQKEKISKGFRLDITPLPA